MMGLQFVSNRLPRPRVVKSKVNTRTVKLHINKNEKPIVFVKKSNAKINSSNGVPGLVM